jgi:ferredoxin
MKYKVEHDRPNCIGSGHCVSVCPKFWEMGKDGKSVLKGSKELKNKWRELEIDEKDLECNKRAAASCPVNVIHIKNIKTGKGII